MKNSLFIRFFSILCIFSFLFFSAGDFLPKVEVAFAAAVSWDGGAGDLKWESLTNWSADAVPTSSDDVTIDNAAITLSSGQTANFSTLTIGSGTNVTSLTLTGNIGTGGSITIANNGTLKQNNAVQQTITGTLTVNSGGTLSHSDNTTTTAYVINISAATITINSGGTVTADAKGFTGGGVYTAGNGPAPGVATASSSGSGAGHSGSGGNGRTSGAITNAGAGGGYCDETNPATMGSGGGGGDATNAGTGDGGGLIILNATGTMTVNGTITADGGGGANGGYPSGSGSGGGIKLTAGIVAGTPSSFTAQGGSGYVNYGGGGGGGCVYLEYTTSNSISTATVTGGTGSNTSAGRGGPGILYIKQVGTHGDLYVSNGGTGGASTIIGASSLSADSLTFTTSSSTSPTVVVPSGKSFSLDNASPFSGSSSTFVGTLSIASGATFTADPDFTVVNAIVKVDSGATFTDSSSMDLTVGSVGTFTLASFSTSTALVLSTLTVLSGGTVNHDDNTTAQTHILNISATTVTINSGGSVTATAKGFTGGAVATTGDGTAGGQGAADKDSAGGAHEGSGGNSADGLTGGTGGYCDETNPATMGSGGGGPGGAVTNAGVGDGGGLILLSVSGTLTISGSLTSNGGAGVNGSWAGGGGAGGGIKVLAGTIAGTPTSFSATGGAGYNSHGGGGGGGCVWAGYTSSTSITTDNLTVTGGSGFAAGSAGTKTVALANTAPTLSVNSAAQDTSGTGKVDVSLELDDADDNDTLKAKIEYKAGADCSSGTSDPTLDETDGNTTADYGDPKVENDNEYQVGNESGWVTTSSGSNTVLFDWASATDLPAGNGTYCIKATPHDGTTAGSSATTTLTLDNVDPTSAGNLVTNAMTSSSLSYALGAAGSDTNLKEYKIYYKVGTSGVTTSDTLHATIASGSYEGGSSTTIEGLSPNVAYTANIWTYDNYGNSVSATEVPAYTAANVPSASTVTAVSTTSLNVLINVNSNPSSTRFAIQEAGESYVQISDGTLGVSASWGTYAEWGGASGKNVVGLSSNTQYTFVVSAMNGSDITTANSASSAKYTLASPVTGISLSNGTTKTTNQLTLTWTNAGQSGVKIDLSSVSGGACDDTFDVGNYDNASTNPASPRTLSTTANTCYKARIESYNGDGALNTTDIATSSGVTTPPAQPTGLAKSDADIDHIDWGWTAVTDATNYKLYRSSDDAYIGQTGDTDVTYTQTTVVDGGAALSSNTQYTVYVRAEGSGGEGIASSTASAYTEANAPSTPGHDSGSQSTTDMKWTWASGGAQKDFYAYMDTPLLNSGYITDLYWLISSTFSANTQYTFNVQARNESDVVTGAATASAYTAQATPTGMTFSSVGMDTITITATGSFSNLTTASSGIRFRNTTTAADNSFQTASWTNASLSPNTLYTYVISGKNGDGDETSTVTDTEYTLAAKPGTPTISGPTSSTLDVTIATSYDPVTYPNSSGTTFEIYESTAGKYVQADGTLGDAAVWQTAATWGTVSGVTGKITVTGLSANVQYTFAVTAKNGDNVETVAGTSASAYTGAAVPGTPTASLGSTSGAQSAYITWTANGNPGTVLYYAERVDNASLNSGWSSSLNWTDTSANRAYVYYCYNVKSKNLDSVESTAVQSNCAVELGSGGGGGGSSSTRSSTKTVTTIKSTRPVAEVEEEEEEPEEEEVVVEDERTVSETVETVTETVRDILEAAVEDDVSGRTGEPVSVDATVDFSTREGGSLDVNIDVEVRPFSEAERSRYAASYKMAISSVAEPSKETREKKQAEVKEKIDRAIGELVANEVSNEVSFEELVRTEGVIPAEDIVEEVAKTEEVLNEVLVEGENLEDLSEEKIEEVTQVVEESVISEIENAIKEDSSLFAEGEVDLYLGDGKIVNVTDSADIVVVLAPVLTEEEVKQAEKVAEDSGKVAVKVDYGSDIGNDKVDDILQMKLGLPLVNADFDGDDIPLADEIFMDLDPFNKDEIPDKPKAVVSGKAVGSTSNLPVVVGDKPLIKIAGQVDDEVSVYVVEVDNTDNKILLNSDDLVIDKGNKGVVVPKESLPDGDYYVVASGEGGIGKISKIKVDYFGTLKSPAIELVEGVEDMPLPLSEGAEVGYGTPLPLSEGAEVGYGTPLPLSEGAEVGYGTPLPLSEGAEVGYGTPLPLSEGAEVGYGTPLPLSEGSVKKVVETVIKAVSASGVAGGEFLEKLSSKLSAMSKVSALNPASVAKGKTVAKSIKGTAKPGSVVMVVWKSMILSSTVLTDAVQGEFEVEVPSELPEGDHEVMVYIFDPDNNVMSDIASLLFRK